MRPRIRRSLAYAAVAAAWTAVTLASGWATAREPEDRLLGVFTFHTDRASEAAFDGIRDGFRAARMRPITVERTAGGDPAAAHEALLEFSVEGVSLVFAIGDEAACRARDTLRGRPVVYTAVTDPAALGLVGSSNACGTASGLSPREVFRLLPRIAPAPARLDIIAEDDDAVAAAVLADAADAPGIAVARVSESAVPRTGSTERTVVWLGPSVDAKTAERVAASLRGSGVALAGSSRTHLDAGCAVVLRTDERALGALAVVQAKAVLDGADPGSLPVRRPSRRLLEVNLDACRSLRVDLPLALLAAADHIAPAYSRRAR